MKGYILLHRSFLDWEWFRNPNVRLVYEYCLLKANFSDTKVQGIELKRGQFLTSVSKIADANGLTTQNVRTALKKLEQCENLTRSTYSKYTIITVLNYDMYQLANNQVTNNQQATNKEVTNNQQTTNKQLTTDNKNNTKNKKKEINKKEKIPPSLEEVKEYIREKNSSVDPVKFVNYYDSVGWKRGNTPIKSWTACVRTWESKSKGRDSPVSKVGEVWY
jgi:predicted transcriptional regulator